jgi:ribonuclease PH
MFVASVPDKIHGAGVLAYPNFMEDAAQKLGGDYFVLPSSIHEVILVRDNGQMSAEELQNMVKDVNASQVSPEEQLTDHAYE